MYYSDSGDDSASARDNASRGKRDIGGSFGSVRSIAYDNTTERNVNWKRVVLLMLVMLMLMLVMVVSLIEMLAMLVRVVVVLAFGVAVEVVVRDAIYSLRCSYN